MQFNLTAKEWQRVLHDDRFLVLPVTHVSDNVKLLVNAVT